MSKSKIVVITGASRGLGRAMVAEFASRGWTVAGCSRTALSIREVTAAYSAPHLFLPADMAIESEVSHFCTAVLERVGVPDLVLNNAAIINRSAALWDVPEDEFSDVIDVNIKGPAAIMRHLLPAMIQRGRGVVVNFSSGWGRSTAPEVAPYCATKFAIEGLSRAVSQETGGRVAVAAMNPGIINTDMLRSSFGESASSYPDAQKWAQRAVPFLEQLGPSDNGKALTAP